MAELYMAELWLFLVALSVAYLLPGPDMLLRALLFVGLVAAVAAIWAAMGACLAGRGDCPARRGSGLARRLAALWLAVLSASLLANAGQALL